MVANIPMWDNGPTLLHNAAIGDILSIPKEPLTTRLHFQNLDGMSISLGGSWDIVCDHWKRMEIDIALAAEHQLDTTQNRVKSKLHDGARKTFGLSNYTLQVGSTPISSPTAFKLGGTLAMAIGNVRGHILEMGSDALGRWVYEKFRRSHNSHLTVICTYQVVEVNPKNSGPTTYTTQLYASYTSQGRNDPHKLQRHHANDLICFVCQCQDKDEAVIVAGDLNETLGLHPHGLTRLCHECSLIDANLSKHMETNFTTYQGGSSVLDYVLVDPSLMDTIRHCGYEPFKINILSDHRGVYVDFSTHHLFGETIRPLASVMVRDISSKKAHQIAPYFKTKCQHLDSHNWFSQIKTLQRSFANNIPNDDLAERLYQRLIAACNYSGERLQQFPPAPYSPEIARLRNIKRYLQLTIAQFTSRFDHSEEIETIRSTLDGIGFTLPQTLRECQQLLHLHSKELRATIKADEHTPNMQWQHQDKLIAEHKAKGNSKAAKRIRGMQRAEDVKRVFQKCNAA